ncbi:MAG: RDD family protein [Solirubrobacteraceae bacterium]|nr:RDD family protein [Solirubrobacteraceae bacterium]
MTDAAVRAAQRAAGFSPPPEAGPAPQGPQYVGIVSRAVALVLDAALLNLVAVVVGASVVLLMDTLGIPERVRGFVVLIAGAVYFVWVVVYFVGFWMINAQTLGDRVMGFRVQRPDGSRVGLRSGVVRLGALVLSAIPLGAGFIPVIFDARRRGFHDRVAGTVVVVGVGDKPHQHLGVPTEPGP